MSYEKKRAAEGAGVLWAVKEKAKPGRDLTKRQRARNRRFGKVRAKVEHVFRVVKCDDRHCHHWPSVLFRGSLTICMGNLVGV